MQDFHKIHAWQKAHELAIAIRRLVSRFPKSEYGSLRRQMIKSAESMADTIAEGAGAQTAPEFGRFLAMSIKSSSELEGQIDRSRGYGLMSEREWQHYSSAVQLVRKLTWGFRQSVLGGGDPGADTTENP